MLALAFPANASEPEIVFEGDTLVVPVVEKKEFRNNSLGYRHSYALYRLVAADQVSASSGAIWLSRRKVSGFQSGGAGTVLAVDRTPVSRSQVDGDVVRFVLRDSAFRKDACYIMVDVASTATPTKRRGPIDERLAVSLAPLASLADARRLAAESDGAYHAARSALEATRQKVEGAEKRLGANRAYSEGRCALLDHAPLPPRPIGAMTLHQALPIAEQIVRDGMAARLGCAATRDAMLQAGLTTQWLRLEREAPCNPDTRHPLFQETEDFFTPFIDGLQRDAERCSDEKLKCMLGAGLIYLTRYQADLNKIIDKLHGPLAQWEREVQRIRQVPVDLKASCDADLAIASTGEEKIGAAIEWLAHKERNNAAAAEKLRTVEATPIPKEAWSCSRPLRNFNTVNQSIVFVN
jgi:hypothetical protein